ncbi:MAG: glycosyltransferase [Patescibacteria group bacterium]
MKKIIFIRTANAIGGAEILSKTILENLYKKNILITYDYQYPKKIKIDHSINISGKTLLEPGSGVKNYIYFHLLYFYNLKNYKRLARKIITNHIDTIVIESFSDKIILTPIIRKLDENINIIWWEHGPFSRGKWIKYSPLLKYLYLKSSKKVNSIVAVSNATKDDIINFGINRKIVCTIYPIVRTKIKKIYYTNFKDFYVSFISRVDLSKGIYEYIQAIEKIESNNIKGIIVGTGLEKNNVLQYIKDNKLQNKIAYFGFQENIEQFLDKSNLLVLPSSSEGLGLILIEALSRSVPILATKVGGIPEVLQNNINGLFIDKNSDDISKKILYLYKNRDLYNTMRNNCVASIHKFNEQKIVKEWKKII